MFCPECYKPIVYLVEGEAKCEPDGTYFVKNNNIRETTLIYPKFMSIKVSKLVPSKYEKEFLEAANTIHTSAKASATLSRRLLQMILHEELKIKKNDLRQEIEEYAKTSGTDSEFLQLLDLLRQVGNYGAHPKKNNNTNEIIEVEKGEAEILLDIISKLFDIVFIKPQIAKQNIDILKKKYLKDVKLG